MGGFNLKAVMVLASLIPAAAWCQCDPATNLCVGYPRVRYSSNQVVVDLWPTLVGNTGSPLVSKNVGVSYQRLVDFGETAGRSLPIPSFRSLGTSQFSFTGLLGSGGAFEPSSVSGESNWMLLMRDWRSYAQALRFVRTAELAEKHWLKMMIPLDGSITAGGTVNITYSLMRSEAAGF